MSDARYRLVGDVHVRLTEELSEVIQAIAKGQRFGWDNYHPSKPGESNSQALLREINDVEVLIAELKAFHDTESWRTSK